MTHLPGGSVPPADVPAWLKLGSEARKFAVALSGALAAVLATGLLPSPWDTYATAVVGLLTAAGVYNVPNATPELSESTTDHGEPPLTY